MTRAALRLTLLVCASALCAQAKAATADHVVVEQAAAAVCDKQFVLLGELPSHGEARGFELKAAIVRRLVQHCGFRAIVFEAPVYDFLGLSTRWGKGSATRAQLDDAIGGFWRTKELAAWRGWLFDEAEHGRLHLAGMDDQVSATSTYAEEKLPSLVALVVPKEEAASCEAAVQRHLAWSYDDAHPWGAAEQRRLAGCAHDAASSPHEVPSPEIDQVLLHSFASYTAREAGIEGARDRDWVMFANAVLHANEKTIVWTATVHAAKRQGSRSDKPVGALYAERWDDHVAAIGFTALGGESSRAGRPPAPLDPMPADSLEARVLGEDANVVFVDAARLRALGSLSSRLFGKPQPEDWSQYFDAVVVVRTEQAPTFEAPSGK